MYKPLPFIGKETIGNRKCKLALILKTESCLLVLVIYSITDWKVTKLSMEHGLVSYGGVFPAHPRQNARPTGAGAAHILWIVQLRIVEIYSNSF